jgi:hypothetical protein
MYFRSLNSTLGGTGQKALSQRAGRPATTVTTNTVASGTNIQITETAGGTALVWFSEPLRAPTGGAISFSTAPLVNLWCRESANTVNAGIALLLERTNNAGAVISTLVARQVVGAEAGTTSALRQASLTVTATTFNAGDRIKATVSVINVGTMGAGTFDFTFDSPLNGVSGDSYIQFSENFITDDILDVSRYEIRGLNGYKG